MNPDRRHKITITLSVLVLAALLDRAAKFFVLASGCGWICNRELAWSLPLPGGQFWLWWFLAMLAWAAVLRSEWSGGGLADLGSLAAIGGGALSNLADRLVWGCVIDHIDLGFWPVFNLADVAITLGALIFLAGRAKSWYIGRVK